MLLRGSVPFVQGRSLGNSEAARCRKQQIQVSRNKEYTRAVSLIDQDIHLACVRVITRTRLARISPALARDVGVPAVPHHRVKSTYVPTLSII